ncbi:MAG: ABC transporter permease [bacterium]
MSTFRQELQSAVRVIWTNPGYVFVTVLVLAVGIGINAMIFSVVNSIVLNPMPLIRSEQLVQLRDVQFSERREGSASYADMLAWRERGHTLSDVAAYHDRDVVMVAPARTAERIEAEETTYNLFPMIGAAPAIGRLFLPQEGTPGASNVVLLSHQLWMTRFGSDSGAVGSSVIIDGQPHTVVGVMPPRFGFPDNQTMWFPIRMTSSESERSSRSLRVVGRLRPGVTVAAAQHDLASVAKLLANEHRETNEDHGVRVIDFREGAAGQMRPVLLLMLGAVGFVLLIVCANVGSLALARASSRQTDLAVRMALGASRAQVVRLLLAESVMIGLLGGAGGIAVANVGLHVVKAALPFEPPLWVVLDINSAVLLYTFAIAIGTGLFFGMIPALKLSQPEVAMLIRGSGRGISAHTGAGRLRSILVVGQLAVSTVLLICALLMVRSFLRLQAAGAGFDPRNILTAKVTAAGARYEVRTEREAFFERLRSGVAEVPGVTGVAEVTQLPVGSSGFSNVVSTEGTAAAGTKPRRVEFRGISANYFGVLGVPLERGRAITTAEAESGALLAIVSRDLAARLWPGEDPIDRRLKLGTIWRTVIGVVPDAPLSDLSGPTLPQLFVPLRSISIGTNIPEQLSLVITTRSPASTASALYALVAKLDPGVPVSEVKEMQQVLSEAFWRQRLFGGLFGAFALFAMLIAVIGVYGTISYGVSLRQHELAVRMALGATNGAVVYLVTRRGAVLAVLGIGLGTVVALLLTRVLASQLYGVGARDLPTFTLSVCILAVAAILASYLPARRATKTSLLPALGSS